MKIYLAGVPGGGFSRLLQKRMWINQKEIIQNQIAFLLPYKNYQFKFDKTEKMKMTFAGTPGTKEGEQMANYNLQSIAFFLGYFSKSI